jgi:hypothetical protein
MFDLLDALFRIFLGLCTLFGLISLTLIGLGLYWIIAELRGAKQEGTPLKCEEDMEAWRERLLREEMMVEE